MAMYFSSPHPPTHVTVPPIYRTLRTSINSLIDRQGLAGRNALLQRGVEVRLALDALDHLHEPARNDNI